MKQSEDQLQEIEVLMEELGKATTPEEKEELILHVIGIYTDNDMYKHAADFLDIHLHKEEYSLFFLHECGFVYRMTGSNEKAVTLFSKVIAHEMDTKDLMIGVCYYELANILEEEGETEGALQHYDKAIALCEEQVELEPDSAINKFHLAACLEGKGDFLMDEFEEDDVQSPLFFEGAANAAGYYTGACGIYEELAASNPENDFSDTLLECYAKLCRNLIALMNWEQALVYCRKCVELNELLAGRDREDLERKESWGNALCDLAVVSINLRYMHNAKKHYEKAKELFEFLYKKKKNLKHHKKILEIATGQDRLNRQR